MAKNVRFPLKAEQFYAIKNSSPSTLTFTLSVNKFIAAYGAAGVVTAVDGSKLKDVTWEAAGQGTSSQLFVRTETAAPSALPTTAPSALPTTAPSELLPTTVPSALATTSPSAAPTTQGATIVCDNAL
jgi:hypothetical protein